MKKKIFLFVITLLCMCLLAGCSCEHEWIEATCTTPKTCNKCEKSEGEPLGHDWTEASCLLPAKCRRCAIVGQDALGHRWFDRLCFGRDICEVCSIYDNNPPEPHVWIEATYGSPKTCDVCGKEEGLSLEQHQKAEDAQLLSKAKALAEDGHYLQAISLLDAAWAQQGNQEFYDASADYRLQFGCYNTSCLAAGEHNSAVLKKDGSLTVVGRKEHGEFDANSWTDLIAISLGDKHIVGLKADGTVVAAGSKDSARCSVSNWRNIVAISAGDSHTVALARDGCVLATGYDEYGQCRGDILMEAAGDKRIVSIAAGYRHTVALLEDGTAVACGDNRFKACNVQQWTNLAAIYAGSTYTAGLKTDGTVVVTGQGVDSWDLSKWTDIVNLAAGDTFLFGVKADGTVISVGIVGKNRTDSHLPTHYWENIVHISVGYNHTVAMNADGEIFCAGVNDYGQCDLASTAVSSTITESTTPANINSKTDTSDSAVAYIQHDDFWGTDYSHFANIVGMRENGEPLWIYMTTCVPDDSVICPSVTLLANDPQNPVIGNYVFVLDNHTVLALDYATGRVVWKHENVDWIPPVEWDGTIPRGENHLQHELTHDIYVAADGTISCSNDQNNCKEHSTVKPVSPAKTAVEVRFNWFENYEYFQDDYIEYANIVGIDRNRNPVWIYRSRSPEISQCSTIQEIGTYRNTYYFLDNGTVTALDVKTGTVLWQNTDIPLAGISSCIDTDGTIYLCGYLANDFVAISSDGKTLAHIETFDENYFWPVAIEKKSGKVYVVFSGTSSDLDYAYNAFAVNLKDYSYEFMPNYPYSP